MTGMSGPWSKGRILSLAIGVVLCGVGVLMIFPPLMN